VELTRLGGHLSAWAATGADRRPGGGSGAGVACDAAITPEHLTAAHGSGTTDQSSEFDVENGDVVLIFTHQKTVNSVAPPKRPADHVHGRRVGEPRRVVADL